MFRSDRDLRKIQILPKASNSLETQGAAMGERQGLAGTRHVVWVENGKAATSEIRLPGSLCRLRLERIEIDLYRLHRIDASCQLKVSSAL